MTLKNYTTLKIPIQNGEAFSKDLSHVIMSGAFSLVWVKKKLTKRQVESCSTLAAS